MLARLLDGSSRRPPVHYIGCFRSEQEDVKTQLEEQVYKHWGQSSTAPPRNRPSESLPEPSLVLLTWNNSAPGFPDSILSKFPEGSAAYHEMVNLKKKLVMQFPEAASAPQQAQSQQSRAATRARAAGQPDFTVEGGKVPLDFSRLLDKVSTPASSFSVERPGPVKIQPTSELN